MCFCKTLVTKTKQYKDLSESVNVKHLHLHWKYWKKKMSIQVYLIKTQALMYQWYAFILFSEMVIDNDNSLWVYEFKRQISRKIFR